MMKIKNLSKWQTRTLVLSLLTLFVLQWNPIGNKAQTSIQILCDTSFDRTQPTEALPRTLYNALLSETGQRGSQFEQITETNTHVFNVPLPPELIGKVFVDSVSPNGRYLALRAKEHNIPFVVWKIGTSELATVLLSDADVDYLTEFILPTSLQEQVLTWTDNNHLLIRYFDLESERPNHLLAEKILTINDNPFQLLEGARVEIPYPNLVAPPQTSFPTSQFSPQRNYVTLVTSYIGDRIQVYDMQSSQPVLVADFQSDETRVIVSDPLWTLDEEKFFILYEGEGLQTAVAQVDVNQGFQINDSLQLALEATFGPNVTLALPSFFTMNDSGTKLVLRIYVPETQVEYFVVYQTDTGSITAICDDADISAQYYFPIWGPDDNYFGYWNGSVIAYDLNTGKGYAAPAEGFIGWISTPVVCEDMACSVNSFSLLASDNSIISEPLANNAELSNLPASVKFRANTNPATVGSVVFSLNGQVVGTSNTAPYDLNWTPLVGQHSLTATPYSGANGTGTAGSPYTVNFSVTGNLNRILFRHNNHIYIMNADGSNPVDLGAGESPSFSPDGSQIAFQLNGTGGREIYLMNADGTNRRQLTNNNIDDRNPSWSPDGSRIVYCSVITGADWELWIMNVDGSNKVQITHNSTDDADPVWSSNDVIAFSALTGSYRQIFTIWSDGSHRTLLTSGNSNKLGPEWSPDGSQLVYNSSGVTNEDIYRINADGTGGLRLTNHASSDIDADWSPDGSQIIFSSDRAGGANRELYRMNADGSAETRFTFTSFDEIQPAWGYP